MSTNQDSPAAEELHIQIPAEAPRPFLQFGLGSLFWVTTVTAVCCAVLFPMPLPVAMPLILLISVALPAVLTTVIIYGRSYQRTFCIGAMFPSGAFLLMIPFGSWGLIRWGSSGGEEFVFRLVVCGFWIATALIGGVCVGVRRLVERRPAPSKQGRP